MPTYEYRCERGHEFSWEQPIKEAALTECKVSRLDDALGWDHCDAPVKRLISRTSFTLKGGGWAADNYGPGGTNPTVDKETP